MCGIAGIYNPKKKNVNKLVKILLRMNETRGAQASGLYGANEGIIKKAIAASDFIHTPEMLRSMTSPIYLLHTRFATHGANTDDNAHPFKLDNTIVTHNGVLYGYEWIKQAYNYSHPVDSANLLPILKARQWDELKKIGGAMTLAWIYEGDDKLYLHKRTNPLHLVRINNIIYYSSEAGPLELLKLMFNSKNIINTITSDRVITIAPDYTYRSISKDTSATYKPAIAYQNWDDYDYGTLTSTTQTSITQTSATGYKRQTQWQTSNNAWKNKNRQKLQNARAEPEATAPKLQNATIAPYGYKHPEPSKAYGLTTEPQAAAPKPAETYYTKNQRYIMEKQQAIKEQYKGQSSGAAPEPKAEMPENKEGGSKKWLVF